MKEQMTGRRPAKKQMIYEAAARLFRDKGYSATSMRDLAREVNLKASSLYNHIGSKEEVLRNICFENARKFISGMKEVEQMERTTTEKLNSLISLHVKMATEDPTSVTSFNDEWRHLKEPHLTKFTALRKDYERRFKAIIREGIAAGELKPLRSSVILYTILSAVRWLYDWFRPGQKISASDLEKDLTRILMEGLKN